MQIRATNRLLAVLPEQMAEEAAIRFMHAGNVFSLVKRTLFEANSKARRFRPKASHRLRRRAIYPHRPQASSPPPEILRRDRGLADMRAMHEIFFRRFACAKKKVACFALSSTAASCEKGRKGHHRPLASRNQGISA
ncbi:MAG: hypothetical protein ACTHNH_08775 [Mesorhizobium sp.]